MARRPLAATVVGAQDAFGNAAVGAPIAVSINSGPPGATLSGTLTSATGTFDDLSIDREGAYSLHARSGPLAADSPSFTLTPFVPAISIADVKVA